jgi:hypothetical protein
MTSVTNETSEKSMPEAARNRTNNSVSSAAIQTVDYSSVAGLCGEAVNVNVYVDVYVHVNVYVDVDEECLRLAGDVEGSVASLCFCGGRW